MNQLLKAIKSKGTILHHLFEFLNIKNTWLGGSIGPMMMSNLQLRFFCTIIRMGMMGASIYDVNPSASTRMEEVWEPQERPCWKENHVWSNSPVASSASVYNLFSPRDPGLPITPCCILNGGRFEDHQYGGLDRPIRFNVFCLISDTKTTHCTGVVSFHTILFNARDMQYCFAGGWHVFLF